MRTIILDVDTGNDDAVAIMMAGLHPDIRLAGCTTVAGNLPVARTTENTLRVLNHIGRTDVPVFQGLGAPFAPRPFPTPAAFVSSAAPVHQEELALRPSPAHVQDTPAVEWLVETLRNTTEAITLVPVGPLTNIAAALTIAPEIVQSVDEIVIMGGSASHGNETPQAEFNIYQDPVAAHVVINAGFEQLTLVTLDATRKARVSAAQCRELEGLGTPAATATAQVLDYYIRGNTDKASESAAVHDALCVAYLLDPAVIDVARLHVAVDTVGFHTYGRTLIDLTGIGGQTPNASVALNADPHTFFELLRSTLAA